MKDSVFVIRCDWIFSTRPSTNVSLSLLRSPVRFRRARLFLSSSDFCFASWCSRCCICSALCAYRIPSPTLYCFVIGLDVCSRAIVNGSAAHRRSLGENPRAYTAQPVNYTCVYLADWSAKHTIHTRNKHIHTNTIVCSYQFRWLARALPFFLFSVSRPFVFHALSHTLAAAQCAFALSRSLDMLWQWCGACVSLFVALHSLWTRARRTQRLAVLFTFTLSPCDSFRQSDDVCVCVCVCSVLFVCVFAIVCVCVCMSFAHLYLNDQKNTLTIHI